ncbi:MAG: translational activator of GCN4 [Thelocarpon impressellum]|nr:MAG: translational activator of GCN4 [Thelocarpon impressellum]
MEGSVGSEEKSESRTNGVKTLQLEAVHAALLSSSTTRRIAELHSVHQKFAEGGLPAETISHLLRYLFDTYAFYNDRPSRRAVQRCLVAVGSDPAAREYLSPFIAAVKAESARPGIAPSNAFVLVEWCSLLLQQCSESRDLWERWNSSLLPALALALELCLGSSVRESVKQSALVVARRAMRHLFSSEFGTDAIKETVAMLTAKASTSTQKNVVLLGVTAGVCSRLPGARTELESFKPDYHAFYVRELISSRTVMMPHIANGLHDFFSAFTTAEDLQRDFAPPLEKALLRAPEVVLHGLISALVKSLAPNIDVTEVLLNNLLKPLLSNVKSTNATIREEAVSTFETAVLRSRDEARLERITAEILDPLKASKISNAEQKVLHARMLGAIPPSLSTFAKIPSGLAAVVGKEPSEAVLNAESLAMARHMSHGLVNGREIEKPILDVFVKGLGDKKVPVRRLWALRFGELVWRMDSTTMKRASTISFASAVVAKLRDAWAEVVSNPLPAAQSGLITAAYVATAVMPSNLFWTEDKGVISVLRDAQILDQALVTEPKPSYMLNHRIYTKLTADDDFIWFLRALVAASDDASREDVPSSVSNAWAQAFLYMISASVVKPDN